MASVQPEDVAQMLVLSALNWTNSEIAAEVGVSESTVSTYINRIEEESKATDVDPESVFMSYYVEGIGARLGELALGP